MGTLNRTSYELRDVLQRHPEACCICRFVYAGIRARIDAIFYEQVTDRDVRAAIRAARGFCRRHSHIVSEHGDALGSALIMQDVLINELRAIEGGEYALSRSGGPFSRLLDTRKSSFAPCPLCLAENDLEAASVDALLDGMDHAEVVTAFQASAGLCLPHLRIVRDHASEGATWDLILATEQHKLQMLADQLGQLARKSDYRFSEEKVSPDEATSWRRALALTSSMEEGV
jgi:hypothetical protein